MNTLKMWDKHSHQISPNQHLIVVTCDDRNSIQDEVDMPVGTDFKFILKEPRGLTTLHTLECKNTFCLVRIRTTGCINSKYSNGIYPLTEQNTFNMIHLQVSMVGLAASMLRLTKAAQAEWRVPETRVILGVNSSLQYETFSIICVNEVGVSCTLAEAMRFAVELVIGLKMIVHRPDDAFVMDGVQKIEGSDNQYNLNYIFFDTDLSSRSAIF